jgi:hypothetical protein
MIRTHNIICDLICERVDDSVRNAICVHVNDSTDYFVWDATRMYFDGENQPGEQSVDRALYSMYQMIDRSSYEL